MRLIRVMCSGRIDLAHVFRAFAKGADGVFIGGCRLNECNYVTHGNYHALSMVSIAKKILGASGISPERLRISFMSGAEANLFVESVNEFVKTIKELGPLGSTENLTKEALSAKLDAVTELIPYIRLVERERLRIPEKSRDAYDKFYGSSDVEKILSETVLDKLALGQIISLLREKPLSTSEIAKLLGLTPSQVARHLATSSRHGFVRYDEGAKRYALA